MTLRPSTEVGGEKKGRRDPAAGGRRESGKIRMVDGDVVPATYKITFPLLSSEEEEEGRLVDLSVVEEEDLPPGVGGIDRNRTLTRQLSAKETTLEAKWEKRRQQTLYRRRRRRRRRGCEAADAAAEEEEEGKAMARVRGLTDEDLDDLRGSIELGFGFNEEDGGHALRDTLPALDLYFAVNRQLSDLRLQCSPRSDGSASSATSSSSNLFGTPSPRSPRDPELDSWKICSPGDKPQDVKVRLRQWAQIVACSVRQCRQGI